MYILFKLIGECNDNRTILTKIKALGLAEGCMHGQSINQQSYNVAQQIHAFTNSGQIIESYNNYTCYLHNLNL